ncbi:hypothetical protein GCM10011325_37050 [Dyadobacter sediminis]|nr:hypothetical protein [Dyadobacter sediminis]GGC06807.1 hypothetical protein GCM10011325_37050 [Dyadobacter sediminis]
MLTAKVYQAKKIFTEDDKEISAEGLKNILLGKSNETRTILKVFAHHNEQIGSTCRSRVRTTNFEALQDREGAYCLLYQV